MKNRLLAAMLITVFLFSMMGTTGTVAAAETRNIVILGTSDLHGNVRNYDYFSDAVPSTNSGRGLTKVFTYVKNALLANQDTILIDNGDTIQGTPLSYYFEMIDTSLPNPMAVTMNTMGYVSSTVGNHEFNYGPTVFNKFQSDAKFPLLAANVTGCRDYKFGTYTIKTIDGVDVGILGLTPPAVPHWEKPENIVGCVFEDPIATAQKYVPEMRAAGADIIVVTAHSGLDEKYGYGLEEDFIPTLATNVPGIDVIVAGHAHATVASQLINGVLVTESGYQAAKLSNIQISLTGSGSDWAVTAKSSKVDAVNTLAEDTSLVTLTQPYHEATRTYINMPIGTATADFPGGFDARIRDSAIGDLINRVQMDAAAAAGYPVQASLAALFTDNAKLNKGDIKLKDAYAVYLYDNTLYVVDASGQMIKDVLEWNATYFNQYYYDPTGVTVNSAMPGYNYDLWSGIDYKIDVTKPAGQRVVELKLHGQPIAMDQIVRIAVNNFRVTSRFAAATKVYQSTTEVRQLVTDWIASHSPISPSTISVQNYTLLPPVNTWVSTMATAPITRSDNANLVWTAFDQMPDYYMKLPTENKAGTTLTREGEFFLLSNKAMENLRDVEVDMTSLNPYTDAKSISSWAKGAAAYTIQAGIFMSSGGKILPKQLVTNAEALAMVREARYPLYTFLSTNDMHGQIEMGKTVSSKPVGGAAFNMVYINNYKALNPLGTMLMDAGDMMQGMPISNLLNGASVIDVYNHMGYQVATVGNHEFDWNQTVLQERMAQAKFPIIVANIFNAGTDTRPSWAIPTVMLTVKGQQVGVIGVTSMYTPTIVMAGNVAGLEFRDPAPYVQQYAAELRAQGADIVVVLAHMPDVYGSVVSQEMATVAVPGVDLIISGHSHSGYSGLINNIPIIQAYSSGTAIGVSNLRYDRLFRNIPTSQLQVVTTYSTGLTPDATIASLVAGYQAQIAPIVTKKIATTIGQIVKATNAAGESPMGDMIADAAQWKAGTDIGLTNPGGVRKDLPDGTFTYPRDLTWGDFFAVQPFDNKLVTMTLTGAQLKAVLEQQFVGCNGQTAQKILQISAKFTYTWTASATACNKVSDMKLNGNPIDSAATYTVSMNNFLATGGDGFTAFLAGTNVAYIGVSDLDALLQYTEHQYGTYPGLSIDPNVYPKIEGRIIKQ